MKTIPLLEKVCYNKSIGGQIWKKIFKKKKAVAQKSLDTPKVKEFDLSVILSFTCGYVVTPGNNLEQIGKQLTLAWFLDENLLFDSYIPPQGSTEKMKQHILSLHPQLKDVKYEPNEGVSIDDWISKQKAIFGEKLPICIMGHTLEEYKIEDKSNDMCDDTEEDLTL